MLHVCQNYDLIKAALFTLRLLPAVLVYMTRVLCNVVILASESCESADGLIVGLWFDALSTVCKEADGV